MPAKNYDEMTAADLEQMVVRLNRFRDDLKIAIGVLNTQQIERVWIAYATTIKTAMGTVGGFARDAIAAADENRTANPDAERAPESAPAKRKKAPGSTSTKQRLSTVKKSAK